MKATITSTTPKLTITVTVVRPVAATITRT